MSDVRSGVDALYDQIAHLRDERDALRRHVDSVIAWCREQHDYCRPPHLADAPDEEVDRRRGPCAAYGAVVYGLTIRRLSDMDEGKAS